MSQKKLVQQSILSFIKRPSQPAQNTQPKPTVDISDDSPKLCVQPQKPSIPKPLESPQSPGVMKPASAFSPFLAVSNNVVDVVTSKSAASSPVSIDVSLYQKMSPEAANKFTAENLDDLELGAQPDSAGQRQYRKLRELVDDNCILFTQNGAFYELYDQDGVFGVEALGLKGVKKQSGHFVAGIPKSTYLFYVAKCLRAGKRVGICDQYDDQDKNFKVQTRKLVRVISKGSVVDEELVSDRNGILYIEQHNPCFASFYYNPVDHSLTKQIFAQLRDIQKYVQTAYAAEVIVDNNDLIPHIQPLCDCDIEVIGDFSNLIQPTYLRAFGCPQQVDMPKTLAKYLTYLNQFVKPQHTENIVILTQSLPRMQLPFTTIQTLELEKVYQQLQSLCTSRFGRRFLRNLLWSPYRDEGQIMEMQRLVKSVEEINMKKILDVVLFRYDNKQAPQILLSLQQALKTADKFQIQHGLGQIKEMLDDFSDLAELKLCGQLQSQMNRLKTQIDEQRLLFLNQLKITHVSDPTFAKAVNSNAAKTAFGFADNRFIVGKQTVSDQQLSKLKIQLQLLDENNQAYFFAPNEAVQQLQQKHSDFEDKQVTQRVQAIFSYCAENSAELVRVYDELARRDVAACFRKLAQKHRGNLWCTPQFSTGLSVIQAVHVTQLSKPFTALTYSNPGLALLTGPNMSGKSTALRTVSLCILLAQCGADVPAQKYASKTFDNLLVRVGGYDFGSSTFQSEMADVQAIVGGATSRSFVVIDEIGRGTEQIASDALGQAILKDLGVRDVCGIISTHSNQLNLCAQVLGLTSYEMAARQTMKKVEFLYEIRVLMENQQSLGCEVAALAGINENVIEKAKRYRQQMQHQIQLDCSRVIEQILNE